MINFGDRTRNAGRKPLPNFDNHFIRRYIKSSLVNTNVGIYTVKLLSQPGHG